MNRRGFLKLLGVGAAAAVAPAIILPERRIWQVSRNAPVPSRFYGVRDILAESGGSLFGVDPGYGTKGFVWARWDDESKTLVVDEIDHEAKRVTVSAFDPANPSNFSRIGSQDLTFDTEAARRWLERPVSLRITAINPTEQHVADALQGALERDPETMRLAARGDEGGVRQRMHQLRTTGVFSAPMPEATYSVLWTSITGTRET